MAQLIARGRGWVGIVKGAKSGSGILPLEPLSPAPRLIFPGMWAGILQFLRLSSSLWLCSPLGRVQTSDVCHCEPRTAAMQSSSLLLGFGTLSFLVGSY